ncbi:hypothetical protein TrVE_jg3627 [Triparma verrucosa]|uniref:Uncharacterized protein n=2 Tax=Triparma TaxID=722752 RepID=A0A9W7C4J0_9STRA|nr:hypothetical protein TrVE_jg3627 [Triparma verrucosa]GMI02705.1 hypothetical protein TrST_g11823 [Triparma strigata]
MNTSTATLLLIALCLAVTSSFTVVPSSSAVSARRVTTELFEYIPSGMSKEQWRKMKEAEKQKTAGKNLGKVGVTSFKSRSFAEWQKAGGKNLFPVDPKKVKDPKDIPYMQRGGAPDDSDLKKPSLFNKWKKEVKEEKEEPKKNWWTF